MSTEKLRLVCMCLAVTCALYTGAAQAQSLFPTIYPKVYEVSCQGNVCGSSTGTCGSGGPFVALGSSGEMQFNSMTAGVGSAQVSVSNGADNLPFGESSFTFTAVNGTAATNPPPTCTASLTAACIPKGCALVTELLTVLKRSSRSILCFSHNGGEFSMVPIGLNAGTFVCHGNALTQ